MSDFGRITFRHATCHLGAVIISRADATIFSIVGRTASSSEVSKGTGTPGLPIRRGAAFKSLKAFSLRSYIRSKII
jgi:hypothetical protein